MVSSLLLTAVLLTSGGVITLLAMLLSPLVSQWMLVFYLSLIISWLWLVNFVLSSDLDKASPCQHDTDALRRENAVLRQAVARLESEREPAVPNMTRTTLSTLHWEYMHHKMLALHRIGEAMARPACMRRVKSDPAVGAHPRGRSR